MKFEVLVSTTDNNLEIIKELEKKNLKYVIINQLINENFTSISNVKNVFSFKEKGLSKSRNRAIKLSKGDICLISDNDVVFKDNIKKTVLESFKKYPEADIITFQIQTPNGKPYKKYKNKSFWHNYRTLLSVSSVEIAFNIKSIKSKNLKFDERFGLGTEFPSGEEAIFLTDALKKGLNILYLPIPIIEHSPISSGNNYQNEKLIEAKGAVFYRIFGKYSYLLLLYFALRKYKYSNLNFYKFYFTLLSGIKKYKRLKSIK